MSSPRLFSSVACLLGLTLSACVLRRASTDEPPVVTVTYAASNEVILNPERGFYSPVDFARPTDFSVYRTALRNTLVHTTVRLDDYRERDLPPELLETLTRRLADVRAAGVKLILRFAYNNGPYPDSEPDASKDQILRHIEQLGPLLQNNADVIAWLEAGFIGAWGEWHTSTHGLDTEPDKRDILFALLEVLPPSRMVQVRYPFDIIRLFPEPITPAQAFAETYQARIGHHNDCFLSSATDVGTYEREGTNTLVSDQQYLAELTRFTPTGGETCAPNPPRSECESTLAEMALLHFTEINLSYHPRVRQGWERGGCFDEIQNRLGYRLSLTTASFNEQVRPGGVLSLTVWLNNTGFASLINPRPLNVVLDGPERWEVTVPIDPRHWEPGASMFRLKLRVPANAPPGTYRLALWLPDGAENLRDNALYAVRFANANMWDESAGLNVLSDKINLDPQAPGAIDPGATRLSLIP